MQLFGLALISYSNQKLDPWSEERDFFEFEQGSRFTFFFQISDRMKSQKKVLSIYLSIYLSMCLPVYHLNCIGQLHE